MSTEDYLQHCIIKVQTFPMEIMFMLVSHTACNFYSSVQLAEQAYEPFPDPFNMAACGWFLSCSVIPLQCFLLF